MVFGPRAWLLSDKIEQIILSLSRYLGIRALWVISQLCVPISFRVLIVQDVSWRIRSKVYKTRAILALTNANRATGSKTRAQDII